MEYECLGCNKTLGGFSDITAGHDMDNLPVPKAFTICVHCGTICRFDENLKAQVATKEDLLELKANSEENYRRLYLASLFIQARIKQN